MHLPRKLPDSSNNRSSTAGFTMVEIVVTVAVLSILIGMVYLAFSQAHRRAQTADSENRASAIKSQAQAYKSRYGQYPAPDSLTSSKFLQLPEGTSMSSTLPTSDYKDGDKTKIYYNVTSNSPHTGACVGYWEHSSNSAKYMLLGSASSVSDCDFAPEPPEPPLPPGCTNPAAPAVSGSVAYSSVGDGGDVMNSSINNIPWNHTLAANTYVLVFVMYNTAYQEPAGVDIDGCPMNFIAKDTSKPSNGTGLAVYGIWNINSGTRSFNISNASGMRYSVVNSIAFQNVRTVGTPQFEKSGASISHNVSTPSGSMTVEALGLYRVSFSSYSGGTNWYNRANSRGHLTLQTTTAANTTFSATSSSASYTPLGAAVTLSN